jgi:AraC family transcriptional regulator, arabinose operon regulatory protein
MQGGGDVSCCSKTSDSPLEHGCAHLWRGRLMLASVCVSADRHRHLAASVLIGMDGPFRLGVGGQPALSTEVAVVAPGIDQQLDSLGGPILVLHVDPDQPSYEHVAAHLSGASVRTSPSSRFLALRDRMRDAFTTRLGCADASRLFADILACVRGDAPNCRGLDARIAHITRRIRNAPPGKIDMAELARSVALSESRLMHLFKQEMGVTIRFFAVCVRVQNAFAQAEADGSLTDLAHLTGFYDLSHFMQTARAYTGMSASVLKSIFSVRRCDCHD